MDQAEEVTASIFYFSTDRESIAKSASYAPSQDLANPLNSSSLDAFLKELKEKKRS